MLGLPAGSSWAAPRFEPPAPTFTATEHPQPTSTHRSVTLAGIQYWLVTETEPLRLTLTGPVSLTLAVRQNLPLRATVPPGPIEIRIERAGPTPAATRLFTVFSMERGPDPAARYREEVPFRPSQESLFRLDLPAGRAEYHISPVGRLPHPLALQLTLHAPVPASQNGAGSARSVAPGSAPAAELTLEELAGVLPAPVEPTAASAAARPQTPSGLDPTHLALLVQGGLSTRLPGGLGPALLGGAALQLGLPPIQLRLGGEVLFAEQQGTADLGVGDAPETRIRQLAFPFTGSVHFAAAAWPLRPRLTVGIGLTWVREELSSLYGHLLRTENLLLFELLLRGGIELPLGPGAVELHLGLRAHPLRLKGDPAAREMFSPMGELLLAYRLDLL